ncbi:hypothetical protein TPY_2354 [Sulfobacillus acidophilus TPY]|uniref:Uncharacterized protein n=1 Tax=Sulfobacillus acidophilus (strain ATCC 700253 / DSM 10332 / NAL) TaxID=679936 RepID=G8U116_SULAD|nr:hypothetical protein TPY_2354 [Sulfobacillus acidophilus TPY]AEW06561.1 hypothetical protein Sulac_3114 [Sulfobacillus acidophilus DSM 10332]
MKEENIKHAAEALDDWFRERYAKTGETDAIIDPTVWATVLGVHPAVVIAAVVWLTAKGRLQRIIRPEGRQAYRWPPAR